MGLFGRQHRAFFGITGAQDLIPGRSMGGPRQVGNQTITDDKALRHDVVWACLKLHCGLISTFPVNQYRDVQGIQTEYNPKPPILTDPGGAKVNMVDFLAMTQMDLARAGNTVGLIVERNAVKSAYHPKGLPSRIELQPTAACSYAHREGRPDRWRIGGKYYDLQDVYHERANVVAGAELGLPTVVYAALAIGEGMSMQQHGLDWFSGGGIPKAWMKNTVKRLTDTERTNAKQWYQDTVVNGELMVTGNDWEYNMIQSEQAGMEFIDGRKLTGAAVCRYFDTPADLVDVQASSGGSITYANITERNLQFLIYHLGPAIIRRESALSRLLPAPRYVKLNTDALLRMDPKARQDVIRSRVESWLLTNSEARLLENEQPLTDAQRAEMVEIYGKPKAAGATGSGAGRPGTEPTPAPSEPAAA